jgi:hypothetical protein
VRTLRAGEPRTVGDYELLGRLGQGAMGTVYLGKSRSGRLVAVKVIHLGLAEDPGFRQRFRREVSTARRIGGFWTAAVVDADPEATPPWLVTEYVSGPTLGQAVLANGPLPESSVRRLAAGLAEALTAVHAAGLVHRDLKPGNVLLAADGPRLIDFGIAQVTEGTALTATGMFLGTPGYLSPEQISGAPVGPASDVFALGAVMTYAATGHGPFGEGETDALLYRAVHHDPDLTGLPASLLDPVSGCLRRDPADRLTPAQVLERLGSEPLPGSDWLPGPVRTLVEERQRALPANGGETRQYTEAAESPPSGRSAGISFRTSRAAALAWGCANLAGAVVAGMVSAPPAAPLVRLAALVLLLLLLANGVRLLVRAVRAQVSLEIGTHALSVRRGGRHHELPWSRVERVRIVDERTKPWLVAWLADGETVPDPLGGTVFRLHRGGLRVYPIAHERPRPQRAREVRELSAALAWYAPGAHDPAK